MHGSAPWKTEETIVGLPRLLVLSVFSRFGGCHLHLSDLVAVTFTFPDLWLSPFFTSAWTPTRPAFTGSRPIRSISRSLSSRFFCPTRIEKHRFSEGAGHCHARAELAPARGLGDKPAFQLFAGTSACSAGTAWLQQRRNKERDGDSHGHQRNGHADPERAGIVGEDKPVRTCFHGRAAHHPVDSDYLGFTAVDCKLPAGIEDVAKDYQASVLEPRCQLQVLRLDSIERYQVTRSTMSTLQEPTKLAGMIRLDPGHFPKIVVTSSWLARSPWI